MLWVPSLSIVDHYCAFSEASRSSTRLLRIGVFTLGDRNYFQNSFFLFHCTVLQNFIKSFKGLQISLNKAVLMLSEFCQNLVDDEVFSTFKARLKIPNITININFNAHALSNSCLDMFSVLSHEYKFSCLFRIARWKQKLLVVMMKGNKLWTQNYLKYVIFVNILCFFVFANTGAFTIVICFFSFS